MNKGFGLFRRDEPRPAASALDPHEPIGARDVHLHDAPPLRPQPTESTPQSPGADSHAPADFPAQLLSVDKPHMRDVFAGYCATLQWPDHLDHALVHDKPAWSEPEPHPGVEGDDEQGRNGE